MHQGAQGAPKRPRPSLKIAVVATALLVVCALATILTATRQTLATNRDEPAFTGGTIGDGCASTLSGADHATSEVRVEADAIRSWDRGFNASGTQVWGAESGPYEFIRIVTKN